MNVFTFLLSVGQEDWILHSYWTDRHCVQTVKQKPLRVGINTLVCMISKWMSALKNGDYHKTISIQVMQGALSVLIFAQY